MRTTKSTLKYLRQNGVKYLDFNAFNEERNSDKYQKEYNFLYKKIVEKRIFKHYQILPYNSKAIFDCFKCQNGKWYGEFYNPSGITFDVEKILKKDFSDLNILEEYKTPNFVFA